MPGSTDLIEGFTAIEKHAVEYLRADDYATGVIPERFATAKIQERLRGSGDAYRFRLARKPITALTNRVGISTITSSAGSTVDARIALIREANDMQQQEPFLIDRAATYGDAYFLVLPVDPDDDEDDGVITLAEQKLRDAGVEISYQSPINCRAMYDSEDGRRMRYVIRRWIEDWPLGRVWRAELFYLGYVESWYTDPGANGTDALQWHPYYEGMERGAAEPGAVWPIPIDSDQIPIRHMRTALPYGRPQHADAFGPQDAITKAMVTMIEVDLEAHGYPERTRLVDEAAAQDSARDTVNWTDDTKAPTLLKQTRQAGGPGTERILRATKDVIQFPSPDPGELVSPLELWVRLMAVATDTPLWEFDPASGVGISGIARWRAEKPLRDREKAFKRYLGQFVREVYTLALDLLDLPVGELTVTWTPQDVEADPDWWSVAAVRESMGVPREEILGEAGYLPAKVAEFLDAKAEERFWGERVAVLSSLAEALNLLSGPVSLGIVDAAKVAKLVDKIMSDAGEQGIGGDGEKDEPEPAPVIMPPGRQQPVIEGGE